MKPDVKDMRDEHLANAVRYHQRKAAWHEQQEEYMRKEIALREVRRWRNRNIPQKCYSRCRLCDCR